MLFWVRYRAPQVRSRRKRVVYLYRNMPHGTLLTESPFPAKCKTCSARYCSYVYVGERTEHVRS